MAGIPGIRVPAQSGPELCEYRRVFMKSNKVHSSVVAALQACGLCLLMSASGVALAADGSNSADISASVTVLADDGCAVTIGAPSHPMEMTWTRKKDEPSSVLVTSSHDPVYVTLTATGGDGCHLNSKMAVRTDPGAGMVTTDDDYPSFRKSFGNRGGYWRIMPLLADTRFFLDENATTQGTGKISWDGPKVGGADDVTFGDTPKNKGGEPLESPPIGVGEFVFMTDEYVEEGGGVLIENESNVGHFSSNNDSEVYKSARIGFGALIATDPENVDGERSPELASAGDKVSMSWVVSFDQA